MSPGPKRRMSWLAAAVAVVCAVAGMLVVGVVVLYAIGISQWGSAK